MEEDYTSVYLSGIFDERDKWIRQINNRINALKEVVDSDNRDYYIRIEELERLKNEMEK